MSKTKPKDYHNRTQAKQTEGKSFDDEALVCIEDGLRELRLFRNKHIGGRSYTLRKAALAFNMAADRMDYAKNLKGETLEPFISKEAE